ncbi:MAG: carboxyl transferase domain-containing protein [Pseudomonadota bacterium]|nr:carboxyl transferase domain-containing protein [Pseudomonadota bacterium]
MPVLPSRIDPDSPGFEENRKVMLARVGELNARLEIVRRGGPTRAVRKHLDRGKMLVRDRVTRILDEDSPFLELSPLAAWGMYEGELPGAGLVCGVGRVHGMEVLVVANDATVKGGAYYPLTVRKHLRAQEIAAQNGLPCVYLVDSGGACLPMQDEVFPDRDHFGRIFFNQARMSASGIPQIAVVMGSCTAGGAYVPAMSDEAVIVARQGTIFLGGPPLVKAATGEITDAETLGGADVHCRTSGVADYLAADDAQALTTARDIVSHREWTRPEARSRDAPSEAPRYPTEEIYGLIPGDLRHPWDVRELVARLVDGSVFDEFKALYGRTLVCGFARIGGFRVGIVANNGILLSESALKGTHFIQLCDRRRTPLVFLQNVVGFMVGKQAEHAGITKHGAKMVTAVACASVPKLTVITGGSFGAGNYAMCGRSCSPRLLWSWPSARIAVMGGETAAELLSEVKRHSREDAGEDWSSEEDSKTREEILALFETQSDPYYATARLWDDAIIDPRDTRDVLIRGLEISSATPEPPGAFGIFRM